MKILPWMAIFLSTPALAFMSDREGSHIVSVSGGIVEPSFATAVFQNPAGIAYIQGFQLGLQGGGGDSLSNPVYRGALLYGDHNFGVTGGVSNSAQQGTGVTTGFGGFGLNIPDLKMQIGAAAFTGISPSGGTSYNIGLIFNPSDKVRLGATAVGVGATREYGGGLAFKLDPSFSLVVDVSVDSNFKNANFQPGFVINSQTAALTFSYGTSPGSQEINHGLSAGVSVFLGNAVTWEAYYNHLDKFYTGLSIRL